MATNVGDLEATLRLKDELTAKLRTVMRDVDDSGKRFQKAGESLERMGRALTPISIAVAGAGAAAFKFGKDFEAAMARVGNITSVGVAGIEDVRKKVLELSGKTAQTPLELAEGLMVVASTGLEAEDAMSVLEAAARASAVGLGETNDIARAVTSSITAYGIENLSAADASNKLFVAVREGGAEASEFAGTLGRVVGIASQVGVSFDEVLGSVATFTRLGVQADEAVTALRGTMSVLLKPSKEATDQLTALGTSMDEVRASVRDKGLAATLMELVALTNGNDEALSNIIPNVRALAGVLGTAGAQGDEYGQVLEKIKTASTELDDAFAVASDTVDFKWNQAIADAQKLAIRVFETFKTEFTGVADALSTVVKWAGQLLDKFEDLDPVSRKLLFAAGTGLAVAGPALVAVGMAMKAIGVSIDAVTAAMTRSIPVASRFWIAISGPIGIAGAGALTGFLIAKHDADAFIASATEAAEAAARWQRIQAGQGTPEDFAALANNRIGGGTAGSAINIGPAVKVVTGGGTSTATGTKPTTIGPTEEQIKAFKKYNEQLADYAILLSQINTVTGSGDISLFGFGPNGISDLSKFTIGNGIPDGALGTPILGSLFSPSAAAAAISDMFRSLPNVINAALVGGGDVAKAIGGMFGQKIFGNPSFLKEMGSKLSGAFGGKVGGFLGSIIPGLGTLLGSGLGSLIGKGFSKLFGGLFGSEGRKVNDLRDQFMSANGGLEAIHKTIASFNNDPQLLAAFNRLYFTGKEGDFKAGMDAYQKRLAELQRQYEAIGGKLGELTSATQAFGGVIPKTFDPLVQSLLQANNLAPEFRAILEGLAGDPSWETLQSIAEKYGIELSALGDKFAQARISDIALGYARDIGILIDSGADLTGILIGMADEMSALVTEALQSGTTLPETLRPYIEKLIEMGLLLGPDGEVRTGIDGINFADIKDDALEAIKELLEQIRDLLANDLPNAAAAAASGINSAFTGINAPSLGEFSASKDEELPGFASGTGGRYLDFGSGTPAMLHGRERVMTESEGAAQASVLTDIKNLLMRMISDQPRATSIAVRDALLAARVR